MVAKLIVKELMLCTHTSPFKFEHDYQIILCCTVL